MKLAYLALRDCSQLDLVESELLVDAGDVLLIAGDPVESFCDHDIDSTGACN